MNFDQKKMEVIRFLILAAQREGERILQDLTKSIGITPAQSEVIHILDLYEPMSLKELGSLLICESGSPSRLVSTLVQRGFVIRKENREDRRYVSLQLSPLGKEKAKEIKSVDEKMYEAMVPNFDSRKMSALYDALVDVFKDHPSAEALKKRKLI
ncbi:MarR family winged helix-turn-helix transcriptional regulator [Neobacillus massiliamazoniensis]|uniref:Putative transcriptional regulato n=1 Tax=Neobacillus massiliamazoniensis TaxID=1499688 RepID=A0A0U1NS14_9BACI|nr:MarR family transcriptional regulator [Neobacillus massiliamazoniensis]CRK80849.1 Putative transcriptional regulato [Neobacillus massiliamazoniensis]